MPPRSCRFVSSAALGPVRPKPIVWLSSTSFDSITANAAAYRPPPGMIRVDSAIEIELDGVGVEVGPVVELHALVEREDDRWCHPRARTLPRVTRPGQPGRPRVSRSAGRRTPATGRIAWSPLKDPGPQRQSIPRVRGVLDDPAAGHSADGLRPARPPPSAMVALVGGLAGRPAPASSAAATAAAAVSAAASQPPPGPWRRPPRQRRTPRRRLRPRRLRQPRPRRWRPAVSSAVAVPASTAAAASRAAWAAASAAACATASATAAAASPRGRGRGVGGIGGGFGGRLGGSGRLLAASSDSAASAARAAEASAASAACEAAAAAAACGGRRLGRGGRCLSRGAGRSARVARGRVDRRRIDGGRRSVIVVVAAADQGQPGGPNARLGACSQHGAARDLSLSQTRPIVAVAHGKILPGFRAGLMWDGPVPKRPKTRPGEAGSQGVLGKYW